MRTITYILMLIFTFIIPWEGVIKVPGLGTAAKLVGIVAVVFWLITVMITGKVRKPGLFHLLFILFVLWNAVSIFWSRDPNRTEAQLITWLQLLGMAFIIWEVYTTRAAILAGLQAYIFGAFFAVGVSAVNFSFGNAFYTYYQRYSPSDTTNPDGFGFILALGIPVAWYLASSKVETKWSSLLKFVNFAYIPAAFLGVALSGTRTALIASIVGMAFGLISLTRLRPVNQIAVILLLLSTIFILLPEVQNLRSFQRLGTTYTELTEGDLNYRLKLWEEGFATFVEHPLLGVGSNMYRSINAQDKLAHNSFLSVLVEVGLIGFTLFCAILAVAAFQALGQTKWEARFWLILLLVWCIGASTLTWEYRKTTWLFLSLIVASAALHGHRIEKTASVFQMSEREAEVLREAEDGRFVDKFKAESTM